MICEECYSDNSRVTPLLKPLECLQNHTQYICSTCGRCICIERDPKRGLQRWNFPFQTLEIAKLYLRTADYSLKKPCEIYEIADKNGRLSYKIFGAPEELKAYLKKNPNKTCDSPHPAFSMPAFREYPQTQIRKLTQNEIEVYLSQR